LPISILIYISLFRALAKIESRAIFRNI